MVEFPSHLLDADEARLAAAAGVVMDSLGLAAPEAFAWITEASGLTGLAVVDLADLVVLEAARAGLRGEHVTGPGVELTQLRLQ